MELERGNLIVLGRRIGIYSGWNEGDAGELQFLDFSPVDELRQSLSDCTALDCDFNTGVFTGYDEDGDITFQADMMIVAFMSREHAIGVDVLANVNGS